MAKHEPWFKPRADEDADDKLLDWLGGRNDPPAKQATSSGCYRIAAPVVAVVIALLAVLL